MLLAKLVGYDVQMPRLNMEVSTAFLESPDTAYCGSMLSLSLSSTKVLNLCVFFTKNSNLSQAHCFSFCNREDARPVHTVSIMCL